MHSASLDELRGVLALYPRLCGYYLLDVVPLRTARTDDEETLTLAIEALDDKPWGSGELRPKDQRWADYEVGESHAQLHVIESLVGGNAVGHTQKTIPDHAAVSLWGGFRNLFLSEARFFMGVGLGNPEYTFQQGIVVVDDEKAGCLFVIESD